MELTEQRATPFVPPTIPSSDQQSILLHELQVHQIELELQNQELRRVQQELEESRDRYADLYDFAPVGYMTLEVNGRILEINLTGATLLDADRSSLIGKFLTSYLPTQEWDKLSHHLHQCTQMQDKATVELSLRTTDGQPVLVQLSSVAVNDRKHLTTVYRTVMLNITERKLAEDEIRRLNAELEQRVRMRTRQLKAANQILLDEIAMRKHSTKSLRQSEEKFRLLIENASDVITILNADATIRYVSPSAERVLGYKPEDMDGKRIFDFVHPDDAPVLWHTFNEILQTAGMTRSVEFLVRHQDMSWRIFESFGKRFFDSAGVAVVVNLRDINRRKQAEEELRHSREQLRDHYVHLQKAIEHERTRIAREIHDELGQALTALKMDIAWLAQKLPSNFKMLRNKAQAMLKSIDNYIKSVQRISAELRPGLLDDLGLSAAIEWQTRKFQERTGIEYEVSFFPEDIVLDQERSTVIFRLFQETLTNIARHAYATKIKICLRQRNNKLLLTVRDNGKGITAEQIRDAKSFGLMGMRERVYPLGGKIRIKGLPSLGTVVHFSIPLQ